MRTITKVRPGDVLYIRQQRYKVNKVYTFLVSATTTGLFGEPKKCTLSLGDLVVSGCEPSVV